jgi:hypothetical protein
MFLLLRTSLGSFRDAKQDENSQHRHLRMACQELETLMLKNIRLALLVVVSSSAILATVGCGGVGAASIGASSLSGVTVSVAPQSMNIVTTATQTFSATVNNSGVTSVSWLVNGFPGGVNPADGTTPYGVIDKSGNYTAPPFVPSAPQVTVTAVANADNNASANATVSISGTPSPVSIAPLAASVDLGRTIGGIPQLGGVALFTGTVDGPNKTLNWLVENVPGGNADLGTISLVPGSLNQVIYIPPQIIPAAGPQVHVVAQSVINPLQVGSALVTMNVPSANGPQVTITSPPIPPTVEVGQQQSFKASVTGTGDTSVSWEVDSIPGGNAGVGTITAAGLYTAPAVLPVAPFTPQVVVTARSNAQPAVQASIYTNLIPAQAVVVSVVPDPLACANPNAVPINTTLQFQATVTGATQNVIWQVNKIAGGNSTVGTITVAGLYTAPAQLPSPTMVVVSAVSVDDPSAVGNEPITISLTPVTAVVVSPSQATIVESQSGPDFTATVLGSTNAEVVWDVNGIQGGDPNTVGSITWGSPSADCVTTAQYVAPPAIPNPNPVPVTAIATDNTTSPPILVTVIPAPLITLAITPQGQVNLMVGQTQPYSANETPADPSDSVTWSVSGNSCTGAACGTITPAVSQPPQPYTAIYTAPLIPPSPDNQVTVTVSSVRHSGVNSSDFPVTITVGSPSIAIVPTFQSVQEGENQLPFSAVIQNFDPTATVVWELGCISDWDGGFLQNCNDTDHDGDGPGCIQVQGGTKACGEQPASGAGNLPLTYTSPEHLLHGVFQANQCSGQQDDGNGYVPLTVTLDAQGCPGNPPVCTATACIQVKP